MLIAGIIASVVVTILFAIISKKVAKTEKNMDKNDFVISQSKMIMWVGIVCFLFFSTLIVFMSIYSNDTAVLWVYLTFILFALGGAAMALFCIGWKVKIIGNKIQYKSFFKHKKTFTFDDIRYIKIKHSAFPYQTTITTTIILYSKGMKKLLTVESNCVGYNIFVERLKQKGIMHKSNLII